MARHWPQSVVALSVVYGLFAGAGAACGSGSSDTSVPGGGKDAGHKDSTAPIGDDTMTDDASGSDATLVDEAGDGATSEAGDDGDNDAGDAANVADGGDASAGDAAIESGLEADGSAEGGQDAGPAPEAGPGDAGDSGGGTTPDAGPDASAHDGGSGADGGACNFAGTWASQISVDVTWAAGGTLDIVIAPGSGTIKQWLLGTRTMSGTTVTDTTAVCGIQLPDFHGSALVNEAYGIRFPNALFDSGDLSTFTIPGTVSGSTPTATYTTSPVAVLLGLTLANPTTAAWPGTITTAVDEDGDHEPGITANVAQGGGFSNVPLDFSVVTGPNSVARANRLYLAIRQVTSVSAHFTDCDHATGSVTVPQLGSGASTKYAIDSHVIGCGLVGGTTDCTATQTTFVDQNQPVFVPTATQFVSTRMPAGTSCATVRGTFQ
jgi:hypothetical protein